MLCKVTDCLMNKILWQHVWSPFWIWSQQHTVIPLLGKAFVFCRLKSQLRSFAVEIAVYLVGEVWHALAARGVTSGQTKNNCLATRQQCNLLYLFYQVSLVEIRKNLLFKRDHGPRASTLTFQTNRHMTSTRWGYIIAISSTPVTNMYEREKHLSANTSSIIRAWNKSQGHYSIRHTSSKMTNDFRWQLETATCLNNLLIYLSFKLLQGHRVL